MNRDRRTILSLVAAGRITVSDAERLLAAWNDSRETAWILLLCLAFACLTQVHLGALLARAAQIIAIGLPALATALQHTVLLITNFWGGLL